MRPVNSTEEMRFFRIAAAASRADAKSKSSDPDENPAALDPVAATVATSILRLVMLAHFNWGPESDDTAYGWPCSVLDRRLTSIARAIEAKILSVETFWWRTFGRARSGWTRNDGMNGLSAIDAIGFE